MPKSSLLKEIEHLISGYQNFYRHHFEHHDSLYEYLVREGQKPKTMIIACSDSRVDPAILLETMPGELFVFRNVANLVPSYSDPLRRHSAGAALAFATLELQVQHIIVMGHSHCGGIHNLMMGQYSDKEVDRAVSEWTKMAEEVKLDILKEHPDLSPTEQEVLCGHQAILMSLDNLKTYPWVLDRVVKQELVLHGWYFNLKSGSLEAFDSESQQFKPLLGYSCAGHE